MGDEIVPTPCDAAIEIGEIAFADRHPESANPFESGDLRIAWLTGWRFAEAKAARDALRYDVRELQRIVAGLVKAIDRLGAIDQ